MSLESKIDALTAAVVNLTSMLQSTTVSVHAQQVPATPVAPAAPQAAAATVPAAAPAPMPAAPVFAAPAAVPTMPAPPSFAAPVAPQTAAAGAPFSDAKGLMDYAMGKYTALGMEKGQLIQNVIQSLGYNALNEVQPHHYAAFYQGVEAIV